MVVARLKAQGSWLCSRTKGGEQRRAEKTMEKAGHGTGTVVTSVRCEVT